MARFTDLNEDVLRLILEHIYFCQGTFHALTLTCKSISELATEFLYYKIDVSCRHPGFTNRFEILLRTLTQPDQRRRCQLLSYIRELSIPHCVDHDGRREPATTRLLNSIEQTHAPGLSTSNFPRLRSAHVIDDVAIQDVARLLYSTPIETVRIGNSYDRNLRTLRTLRNRRHLRNASPPTVSLSNLPRRQDPLASLSIHTHYPPATLRDLLLISGGVKQLVLREPGTMTASPFDPRVGAHLGIMSGRYSPAQFGDALAPLRATLQSLDLTTSETLKWPGGHDGSRLDLRAFGRLRRVRADSKCFFPHPSRNNKEDICPLLPASIEALELCFDFMDSAVTRVVLGIGEADDYQWIVNLVQGAPAWVPRLQSLKVKEEGVLSRVVCGVYVDAFREWDPPPHVKAILAAGLVAVEVTVKVLNKDGVEARGRILEL
ncbi:RNI-like protein [Lasiodiplodia theobromae]|uniref:RNI-like protein n=1 Tax=Lasiodiplodia theobromae TaxID=45133 RepID=UPI0015C3558F|nr:RNI-like protein [Lasiodiplodia theobromae]KAF4537166.1 RNI-like protein [Lasiodiplodia theobromae]